MAFKRTMHAVDTHAGTPGRLVEETTMAGKTAALPMPTGTSWIYGLNTDVLDPDDPCTGGFTVEDSRA